jgi:hypothetical protein
MIIAMDGVTIPKHIATSCVMLPGIKSCSGIWKRQVLQYAVSYYEFLVEDGFHYRYTSVHALNDVFPHNKRYAAVNDWQHDQLLQRLYN